MMGTEEMNARDRLLIERAEKTLQNNVIRASSAEGSSPYGNYRGIAPSPRTYPGVWNWDAAFHMIAVSRFDPDLARDQARILFSRQMENGQLADVLYANGESVFRFTKPPVLAWAIALVDERAPDDLFLAQCYPCLEKNLAWWERERSDGTLFFYRVSKMESGWDNTPRFDFPNKIDWCYAVDLNGYMVLFYEAMAKISRRIGKLEQEHAYLAQKQTLEATIEQLLFDQRHGYYCDYNHVLRRFTGRLSPASFLPLFAHTASREHAEAMAKLAASEHAFYPRLPTIAYGDSAYRSANYWRGPTWLNTAFFAIRGLYDYGHRVLALELTKTILDWCAKEENAIFEYYDSRSGKGLGARDFGWSSAFIIELVFFRYGAQGEGRV